MIQFAWPWCFAFLPLPWLLRYLLPEARHSHNTALRVPFYAEMAALQAQTVSGGRRARGWRHLLLALIWLLLVLAAARPQWLGEPVNLPVSGRDLLLAVDLSGSMDTADMELHGKRADRYTIVAKVLEEFIQRREGDRIGLIFFGTRAYVQTPLTFDRRTVGEMLQDGIEKQKLALLLTRRTRQDYSLTGLETAIGDAVGLAVKRLRERPEENRVLILLTDGSNTAGETVPAKAAELAAQAGVRIYTVGIGRDGRDVFGRPVSDLDEATLKQMAKTTGGRYFRARAREELEEIYQTLDALEPVADEAEVFRPMQPLFYWPLGVAFGLVLGWTVGWRAKR